MQHEDVDWTLGEVRTMACVPDPCASGRRLWVSGLEWAKKKKKWPVPPLCQGRVSAYLKETVVRPLLGGKTLLEFPTPPHPNTE